MQRQWGLKTRVNVTLGENAALYHTKGNVRRLPPIPRSNDDSHAPTVLCTCTNSQIPSIGSSTSAVTKGASFSPTGVWNVSMLKDAILHSQLSLSTDLLCAWPETRGSNMLCITTLCIGSIYYSHTHVSKHLCIGVFLGDMSGEVVFAIELEMAHPALVLKGGIVPVFPLVSYPSPNVCKPLTTNWANLTPRQVTATEMMIHVLVHRNIHLLIHTTEISVLWELASVSHSEGRETVCTIHIGMQIRQSSTCPTEQKHDSFWH